MLGSWVIWEILLVAHVAKLSWAFAFTYPTNDTNWARDEALRVDWTSNRCAKRALPDVMEQRFRAFLSDADMAFAVMIPPPSPYFSATCG